MLHIYNSSVISIFLSIENKGTEMSKRDAQHTALELRSAKSRTHFNYAEGSYYRFLLDLLFYTNINSIVFILSCLSYGRREGHHGFKAVVPAYAQRYNGK